MSAAAPAAAAAAAAPPQPTLEASAPPAGIYQGHSKLRYFFPALPDAQRRQLWLDDEALYSVSDGHAADCMTELLRQFVPRGRVLDATACVGGNVYSLARTYDEVLAVEISPAREELLRRNLGVLCVPFLREGEPTPQKHDGRLPLVRCYCRDAVELLRAGAASLDAQNAAVGSTPAAKKAHRAKEGSASGETNAEATAEHGETAAAAAKEEAKTTDAPAKSADPPALQNSEQKDRPGSPAAASAAAPPAEFPVNAIVVDPPWGGPEYHQDAALELYMSGVSLPEFVLLAGAVAPVVMCKVPLNYAFDAFERAVSAYPQTALIFRGKLRKFAVIVVVFSAGREGRAWPHKLQAKQPTDQALLDLSETVMTDRRMWRRGVTVGQLTHLMAADTSSAESGARTYPLPRKPGSYNHLAAKRRRHQDSV